MGLKEKFAKLNSHYKKDGLIATIGLINHKTAEAIRSNYPFKYQYPSQITIEIMDICNLKCSHCYLQSQVKSSPSRGFMDYDFFEQIIKRISPLIKRAYHVNFLSVESLFHKRIFDMIDLVRKQNRNVGMSIITNGMLLDEKKIDRLLERDIHSITFSLDGWKKETVESFKRGTDFDRVVINIKRARERSKDKFNLTTNFVAHKRNIHELLNYIDFCKSLGISRIHINGFVSYSPEMRDYCLYSWEGNKEVDELFRQAKQKARTLGIILNYESTKLQPRGCNLFSRMYIDINGNIVSCVLLSVKTQLVLLDKVGFTEPIIWGNVFEEDPCNIWRSKASVDFRRLLYEDKLPKECSLCAIGYGVIC